MEPIDYESLMPTLSAEDQLLLIATLFADAAMHIKAGLVNPETEEATTRRVLCTHVLGEAFTAVRHSHGEAKVRLMLGLNQGQRLDSGSEI